MSRNQTTDKKQLLLRLVKTPIVEAACNQTNVPRSTYYRWRKDDESFAEACDEAIELSASVVNDLAESQLISAIKDQNMTAVMFWLKHHHRSYRTRVEIDAKIESVQQELTPEQADLVSQALKLAGLTTENNKEIQDE